MGTENSHVCHSKWSGLLSSTVALLILSLLILQTNGGGELGTIECVDGKWKVDTRIMALIMTCPLPLDGNTDSILKMAKCAMNKLGIYDGQDLSEDFEETLCDIFSQDNLKDQCVDMASSCAFFSGVKANWELTWPAFGLCFAPWAMGICNI